MKTAGKTRKAKPKQTSFGQRLLAAMEELNTPEAAEAAITGHAPPGAPFRVTRVPVLTAEAVAAIRAELGQTQAEFAAFLNVAVQTVHAWEQGRNTPSGIALRFLTAIRDDLPYWKKKLATARPA